MQCDRCRKDIKANETTYTVQYEDSPHPEEICESCIDKDGEKISKFIELGFQLRVTMPQSHQLRSKS